ncbi:hypothetical protein Bca4012_017913 [Brassica carinata]
MSYIPPHKRHSKDPIRPSPFPDSLVTKFKKNIDFKSRSAESKVITYSRDAISKWFLVSSNGIDDEVPPSIKLVPVSSDSSEYRRYGETSLVLMNTSLHKAEETEEEEERTRWMLVAEKIEKDLVFAYEQAKQIMEDHHLSVNAKLRLVARRQAAHATENSQENMNMIFSTDVPTCFMQNIKYKAISSHGFCIDVEKEVYAEMNPLRHLVVDVSCIDKNLDMRFMLAGKRKIMNLTEKETSSIQGLLDSATVDSSVKGGLRTLKLRVREADRFNERFGTREVESGVTLILQDINTKLQEQNIERGCVLEMLRDALGTIWDFLHGDASLTNLGTSQDVESTKGSVMSYIPPHRRHSNDPNRPSPVPDSLQKFKSRSAKGKVITYSKDAISKWFLIGSNGIEDEVPPSIKLVPVSSDSPECRRYGDKYLVLMNTNAPKVDESEDEERTRWMLIAEKIEKDLAYAYEHDKKGRPHLPDNVKLRLVARFGKLLFRRSQADPITEYWQKKTNRTFSTDVPTSFIQNIKSKAIPSHEFCIDMEKEVYVLQISHHSRPRATIRCKCTAELNPLRHFVVDVSCIDKSLDMRFMLAGKRKMITLTEKETSNIQGILDLATIDSNVEGGLRWPLGKPSSEKGYKVLEVCHVRATTYKNQTLRLRVRETNGFSERFGTWEDERGVTLILQDINTKIQEQNIERGCVLEMLRDALGTIWDFLHCDASLT